MTRTAVVLFNLGGPDSPEAIRPFLNNLFNDPAIIGLPWPLRPILASVISNKRQKEAREIYTRIGGRSPLLEETCAQARALETAVGDDDTRVFIAMRYWHPMSEDTAFEVAQFKPDRVVLLPLYPQFSTTTTGSSLKEWARAAKKMGVTAPTTTVCCYPMQAGVVEAHARLLKNALDDAGDQPVRVLFSAHGLPEKIVKAGDPYQWQVEQTAAAVVERSDLPDLDWQVCYQSRVGPLAWIGPSTDDEIRRAGSDGKGAVVIPVAFVSEHSETLVELDIEYAEMAAKAGCAPYIRVPALSVNNAFIEGLAGMVRDALEPGRPALCANTGARVCSATWGKCPCREAA
ncbi:MAG: ferrochelatase [Rhodospirillaceae bacterium]|nr:ferrochelatase [Rhodospirillaceae bacterium]